MNPPLPNLATSGAQDIWQEYENMAVLMRDLPTPLDALASKYDTDKSSRFHNFARYYYRHFLPIKQNVTRVLEVGVKSGASLKMWSEFFPNATIFGIDNDPNSFQCQEGNIRTFLGDQTNIAFLQDVATACGNQFDIVIDDGGHRMAEQMLTLQTFLPLVNSKGIYVIEDLHTSYWDFCQGGYKKPGTAIERIKDMIDELNLFGKVDCGDPQTALQALKAHHPDKPLTYCEQHLHELHLYKSIAFLVKR